MVCVRNDTVDYRFFLFLDSDIWSWKEENIDVSPPNHWLIVTLRKINLYFAHMSLRFVKKLVFVHGRFFGGFHIRTAFPVDCRHSFRTWRRDGTSRPSTARWISYFKIIFLIRTMYLITVNNINSLCKKCVKYLLMFHLLSFSVNV
jgi:hypothetical protein